MNGFAVVACACLCQAPLPMAHTGRVAATPDLCQIDKAGGFADGGSEYCGPVAVSDHLVWLANNGYPKLFPGPKRGKTGQIELVNALARDDYMATAKFAGTPPHRLTKGVRQFVTDRGYEVERLDYFGDRPADGAFVPNGRHFTPDQVRQGVANPHGCVWLNIQWSARDAATGDYRDVGRHWLCVVGYGEDERRRPAPDVFLVHDPSGRSGLTKSTHFVTLSPIASGKFEAAGGCTMQPVISRSSTVWCSRRERTGHWLSGP